ncbi:MAG: hypothetical protein ACRD0N_10775 [Acidimicrobiales bacterium]
MSFMVNFRSAEGKQGYHPTDTLEEAVRFVEHVRNQEHVTDARVWRLQEIPLEVKTYYKVEVVAPGTEPAPVARQEEEPRAEAVPVAAGVEVTGLTGPGGPVAQAVPGGPAGPNGARFGRFNRT